jgi:hypothetical protein
MSTVDLNADLIPGTSAAGWRIGVRLPECHAMTRGATEVEYRPGFNLVDAIIHNAGVLVVRNTFPLGSGHTAVVVGADVVRFGFNARGELFEVSVREGYHGRAFGSVGIGNSVAEVRSLFPVFFDSGDELFYPDTELAPHAPSGIGFYAGDDEPPDDAPIMAISVHDWDIMRRSPARQAEAEPLKQAERGR